MDVLPPTQLFAAIETKVRASGLEFASIRPYRHPVAVAGN